jgi:calcineurin-like phosphoesterase
MSVKILAVGDVCGEPGLAFLNNNLKKYREEQGIGFVVVNGENANVVGITPKQADLILRAGADVVTLGNHTWTRTELRPYLEERRRILRPANFAPQCPGKGIEVYYKREGDFVRICVQDHGVGIAADRIDSIFHKGETTYGTGGEEGSGLGLQLCQDFARKNGGDAMVESVLGEGSTFSFTIPLKREE